MKSHNNKHIVLNLFLTIFAVIYLFKIEGDFISYNSYYEQPVQDNIELVSEDSEVCFQLGNFNLDLSQIEKCSLNANHSKTYNKLYVIYYKNRITTFYNTSLNASFFIKPTSVKYRKLYSIDNSSDELPPHIA